MKPRLLYQQAVQDWDAEIAALTGGLLYACQILQMQAFRQHGSVTTYLHSVAVSRCCLLISNIP